MTASESAWLATRNPFTYVAYDLYTGRFLGQIPLAGVTFGSQLLQPGTLSGTLNFADPSIQKLGPLNLTAPARTCLCVDYLGSLIWAGIIWPRNYDFSSVNRTLTVTATELWSIFNQRVQATDYSSPPYSLLTGPSTKMTIWDATNTDGTGVYDPVLIAWQLLSDALTQVKYGNILGGIGIAANGYTSTSAYLASGTATPSDYYDSVSYPLASAQQLSTMINMLATNGLLVGFDYGIDVTYSAGQWSPPVATVNLSYPVRGRTQSANQLVLDCGSALSYQLPEDGSQSANTVYEQGSSGSLVVSQNIQPLEGGYPLLEAIKSRANIQSANLLNVLSEIGLSDLVVGSYPVATPSVTMDLFDSTVPLGEFVVGDQVRWRVPATDGQGNVWDPRLPNGLDEDWRIIGYSAKVADEGQSTLTFQLSVPPSLTIGGPPLP